MRSIGFRLLKQYPAGRVLTNENALRWWIVTAVQRPLAQFDATSLRKTVADQ
jgi:hypothetical protein